MEVFKVVYAFYPETDKSKILSYLRLVDSKSLGYVTYEQFNKTMKKFIENNQISLLIKKILKEHENLRGILRISHQIQQ
jgi:hypothetical protein